MNDKVLQQLEQTIQHAQHGYWIPLAIVAGLFTLIIALLIYIYNMHQKQHNARHERSEVIMEEQQQITKRLDTIIEGHDIMIKSNKAEVDRLRNAG